MCLQYTYRWIVDPYEKCPILCKDEDTDLPGNQTRNVYCTYQDGEVVDDSFCEIGDKPQSNRTCNNFLCGMCISLLRSFQYIFMYWL